jgi:hypothetical protein
MSDDKQLAPPPITPAPSPALPTAREPKMRKPPPWVRQAVDLLLSDPAIEITDIAEKVQLSRERVSRALGEPHVTAYIQRRASRKVARLAAKGAARMEQLLAKAKSEQVQYRAAEFVLEASGIARANHGAKTRAGRPCRMRVEFGKARCRLHGGLSTGPKTEAGRAGLQKPSVGAGVIIEKGEAMRSRPSTLRTPST